MILTFLFFFFSKCQQTLLLLSEESGLAFPDGKQEKRSEREGVEEQGQRMRLLKHPERETPRVQGRGKGEERESRRPVAPQPPHGLLCSFVPFTLQIRNLGLQEVNRLTLDNKAKFKKKKSKIETGTQSFWFHKANVFQRERLFSQTKGEKDP